jgi:tyrosyl-tRNA synthetase
MPLLIGTDGVEKMSKSMDNYIGIDDSPKDIFGKTLSIPDSLIYNYYELATDVSNDDLKRVKQDLANKEVNPRDIKRTLARKLVEMYHSLEQAESAEKEFDTIFVKKGLPDEIPEFIFDDNTGEIEIVDLIVKVGFAPTKSEARRLITQGGVSVDNEKIVDFKAILKIEGEKILKVGKRNFIKISGKK